MIHFSSLSYSVEQPDVLLPLASSLSVSQKGMGSVPPEGDAVPPALLVTSPIPASGDSIRKLEMSLEVPFL